MRKIAIAIVSIGIALIGAAPAAMANKPGEDGIDLPRGTHIKVDICHWANGHPHKVPVSVSAVTTEQDVKHGSLTMTSGATLVSFTAHDAPGHKTADDPSTEGENEAGEDFVLRIYTKHGNTEVDTWVNSNQDCGDTKPEEPELVTAEVCLNGVVTTFGPGDELVVDAQVDAFLDANPDAVVGDECPVEETTTTTVPETTTTTVAEVVETPAPSVLRSAPQPVAAPTGQLPHTGSNNTLAIIGGILLLLGAATAGASRLIKN